MTESTTIAMAHWRRLDREGTDRCTLAQVHMGWMLSGQAIWRDDGAESTLTYAVRCGPDWRSLSADITGNCNGRRVNIRIAQGASGWEMNNEPQEVDDDCLDIDLSFTPATNLLAIRRLAARGNGDSSCAAVWLVPELDRLERLDQSYTRREDGYDYTASTGFSARLAVHPTGFVTCYPGYWDGWVDD